MDDCKQDQVNKTDPTQQTKNCVLGIDLGTSNSALSWRLHETVQASILPITQVVEAGMIQERNLLPSALYFPLPEEREVVGLPWSSYEPPSTCAGYFARERGSLLPDRLITSAKSWLCNIHVDRKAPILPWRSQTVDNKISPFEASSLYLEHLVRAFNHQHFLGNLGGTATLPDGIDSCSVVLTVPASFDEVARSLTRDAAEVAGLKDVTLLEEPQAAFYAWLEQAGDNWREQVQPGDVVLITDVGGGTSDFSMIAVSEADGNLALERISVGEHILLGGDNMDLALAYLLRANLENDGHSIDDWQFLTLIHSSRAAKEKILTEDWQEVPISIPSRSASLFASTIATKLQRDQVFSLVLDGFFPLNSSGDEPQGKSGIGLQEFGLDFASDPAMTKHLARFLRRSYTNVTSSEHISRLVPGHCLKDNPAMLLPTKVLFNGGVFKASALRQRVMEALKTWAHGSHITELQGADLDLAVSRGAAYYGSLRQDDSSLRIRAGTARSYYLGLESSMPAIPGFQPPVKALCVVAQGTEEGTATNVENQEFGLITGQPVYFRFFSSDIRAGDAVGQIVANAEKELTETSSLQAELQIDDLPPGTPVPVRLHTNVTELGTLEIWMHHTRSDERWRLEFDVRNKN